MYTDKELIAGCKKNDRVMQKALYETYAPRLLVVCQRYMSSGQEAEDVLQEALIKIFKSIDKFRGESHLFYWLKRITVNTALNALRNRMQVESIETGPAMYTESGWDAVADLELEELIGLIWELPQGCQLVFNMYVIEGYKHDEIASQLGISAGTSKSQLARAKTLLQEKIRKEELKNHG